jgi:hypothetical protein
LEEGTGGLAPTPAVNERKNTRYARIDRFDNPHWTEGPAPEKGKSFGAQSDPRCAVRTKS